jgi:hypothetical protein
VPLLLCHERFNEASLPIQYLHTGWMLAKIPGSTTGLVH